MYRKQRAPRLEHEDRIWAKCELAAAHMRKDDEAINVALCKLVRAMEEHPMTQEEWLKQHTIPPYTFENYVWCRRCREYHERGVETCPWFTG